MLPMPAATWFADSAEVVITPIEVPTPSGAVELKIPAGSVEGRKLRLKGRGIPSATPGDFYFVLKIAAPPATDEAGQAIYRSMAAHFKSFAPRANLGAKT